MTRHDGGHRPLDSHARVLRRAIEDLGHVGRARHPMGGDAWDGFEVNRLGHTRSFSLKSHAAAMRSAPRKLSGERDGLQGVFRDSIGSPVTTHFDPSQVLVMILAGGEGKRLYPLTLDRAKPAVPFGGRYRIIDIVLSNFVNSGMVRIKILTQYKSASLEEHIARVWRLSPILDQFIEAIPEPVGVAAIPALRAGKPVRPSLDFEYCVG